MKLNELLNNVKVEWKTLGEVCISLPKGTLKTTQLLDDGYPVINSGRDLYGYYSQFNNEKNAFTIAARGEYAGFINFMSSKFWAGGLCYPYRSKDENKLLTKFIFYFLKRQEQNIMDTLVAKGSIPAINKSDCDKIQIPIPPLEIQEKIAKILDKFTNYATELRTELRLRNKQYEYYRNLLLSKDYLKKLCLKFGDETNAEQLEIFKIEEIFEIRNGYTPSKQNKDFWENGTIPWFRMDDIREQGSILKNSKQNITQKAVKGKGLFKSGSIILATSATIGEHAMLLSDSLANQRFTNFEISKKFKNLLMPKYIFYYFYLIDQWCKDNVNVSNFNSVNMDALVKLEIPISPLKVQNEVVRILDKFSDISSNLEKGLPKEIDLRQKQYEFYRDLLLNFKKD